MYSICMPLKFFGKAAYMGFKNASSRSNLISPGFNMCAWCPYTQRRLNVHTDGFWMDTRKSKGRSGSSPVLLTKICPRASSRAPEVHQTSPWILLISFVSHQHTLELHLSLWKLRKESAVRWFDLSFAPIPKFQERLASRYRNEPSLRKKNSPLSGVNKSLSNHFQDHGMHPDT